ncbi:MAG: cytochrome c biogenesis protein CcdA [Ruminococcaceae bacterium]|nr:cytochrome c biogenesis protein CcdA [Oscillospiraceae bacterium]
MQYLITFLEGIITFISPCLLPMLPIYISYFAGGEANRAKTVKNSLGFVLGFTAVFVCMGALAGSVGSFLKEYRTFVNIVTGLVVIVFGLNYTGILKFNIFKGISNKGDVSNMGFISSILFGIVFSIGWTPCVGAFLGSALMLASVEGKVLSGIIMLLLYSLGLGIPFVVSALLIDRLKSAFDFVKKHYRVINIVCGCLLILVGVLMMTGLLGRALTVLA